MKKMKWMGMLAGLLCAAMFVTACGSDKNNTDKSNVNDPASGEEQGNVTEPDINLEGSILIKLDDENTDVGQSGAVYEDGTLSITKAGVYRLQGTLTDGQVYVSVDKTKAETVELILDGCSITCKTSAAIYCDSAEKLYITANAGTKNTLTDAYNYIYTEVGMDEPNACIFSDDDTTIRGNGELVVNGNFKNGISGKNDIKIKDLTLTVNAANTGIRGKDSVEINSGSVTVVAQKDGLKASQTEKDGKGYVEINGGNVDITAGDDAIQAVLKITVNGGKVVASYDGKAFNCDGEVYTADGTFTEK